VAAEAVMTGGKVRVGLISDTHGLLRPEALHFLRGCDFIVHGGDIGNVGILAQLAAIAPLTVVRGNNDTGAWAEDIPQTASLEIGGVTIHVLHDIAQLDKAGAAGAGVVVSGHSHKPSVRQEQGVLYVNPGSAGRRRFKLPVAAGELLLEGGQVSANIVRLLDDDSSRATAAARLA
jgi:putative phosphoesterase